MRRSISTAILALTLLTAACVQQVAPADDETLPKAVKSIAVLPVVAVPETAVGNSPLARKQMQDGVAALAQVLADTLSSNSKVRLLTNDEVESYLPGYSANQVAEARVVGQGLKAEAVMVWEVSRFRERQGTDYAVQSPASVAFDYRLVHTESGKTLCAASFDETQQSASDNLLSLRALANRGFKWISASDLLQEGVTKKLPDCDYLKAAE